MTGFIGADTDALRTQADRIHEHIGKLYELNARLTGGVSTLQWTGADAEDFKARLQAAPGHVDSLRMTLADRASTLRTNAREQDQASADSSTWIDRWNDFIKPFADASRAAKDVFTIATKGKQVVELGLQIRDLQRLKEFFPGLAKMEWEAIGDSWNFWKKVADPNNGLEGFGGIPKLLEKATGITIPGKEWAGDLLKHVDNAAPWLKAASRGVGRFLPFADIGFGIADIATGDTYKKVSGSLSVASGSLMLAAPLFGPAAPVVAGVGAAVGVVSAAMDLGKLAYDYVPAFKNVVDTAGEAVSNTVNAVSTGVKAVGSFLGSLF